MRAEYETQTDSIAIELTSGGRADHGDDSVPGAVVHLRGGRPVAIDLIGVRSGVDAALVAVSAAHGLDRESLLAAARAALAAPDRVVELDVHARALA
jgi:hypothetical protein